jgi:hypothetical protein
MIRREKKGKKITKFFEIYLIRSFFFSFFFVLSATNCSFLFGRMYYCVVAVFCTIGGEEFPNFHSIASPANPIEQQQQNGRTIPMTTMAILGPNSEGHQEYTFDVSVRILSMHTDPSTIIAKHPHAIEHHTEIAPYFTPRKSRTCFLRYARFFVFNSGNGTCTVWSSPGSCIVDARVYGKVLP